MSIRYIKNSKFVRIILTSLLNGNTTLMDIARKNNVYVYSALVDARKALEKYDLITSERKGRNRILAITEKGIELAKSLQATDNIIDSIGEKS